MNEHHFLEMAIIMIISGILSTMNMWAYSFSHIRFSLNDMYMISLMTGWMLFFMGIYYTSLKYTGIGFVMVVLSISAIRNQWFITYDEYIKGMIPHHSMALTMSKPHLDQPFAQHIFVSQLAEIDEMSKIIAL
jgi:hypothetical protein